MKKIAVKLRPDKKHVHFARETNLCQNEEILANTAAESRANF